MVRARQMLSDFVENKMREGDLVAIVRTVGGKGMLEQFTSDRQILRRAIAQLGVRSIPPYLAFGGPDAGRITGTPSPINGAVVNSETGNVDTVNSEFEGPSEGPNQVMRGVLALTTASYLRSEEHTSELQSHSDLVCRL